MVTHRAWGPGLSLAKVSATVCGMRMDEALPSPEAGRPGSSRRFWVTGIWEPASCLPAGIRLPASLCSLLHLQIPVTMPISWGLCVGYRSSPVLGKQQALLKWLFSRDQNRRFPVFHPAGDLGVCPGAQAAGLRACPCPVHLMSHRRPRRLNERQAGGQDCVASLSGCRCPGEWMLGHFQGPCAGDDSAEPPAVLS